MWGFVPGTRVKVRRCCVKPLHYRVDCPCGMLSTPHRTWQQAMNVAWNHLRAHHGTDQPGRQATTWRDALDVRRG